MNLATVAQQLAAQLGTITPLLGKTTAYAPDAITPPWGYVFGPETEYHQSYANGLVRATWALTVAVARDPLDVSWEALAGFCSDTGDTSVKACLEAGTYTAFHTIVVLRSRIGPVDIAGGSYRGAQFDIDITGSGA